jgi:predicted O-methyltransferase YrrM
MALRPQIHRTPEGVEMDMSLSPDVLDFLLENIPPDAATLETGCGLSTILFAHLSRRHTVITPISPEFDTVQQVCRENGIKTDGLDFRAASSDYVLPRLETEPLDLVLIDGRHGFGFTVVDWFYSAAMLKVGGLMVVDDCWLWPPRVVSELLAEQPEWEQVRTFGEPPRTSVFRKLAEGGERGDWNEQPYGYRQGFLRMKDGKPVLELPPPPNMLERVVGHLSRGEVSLLARKALRRLNPF